MTREEEVSTVSELNATLDLPLGNAAPAAARKAMRHMLIAWQLTDPDWLDDAELVVSELVTNAVRFGGGCIELSMQSHEGRVILRAADGSSVVPRDRGPGAEGRGYGIRLIESCGEAWGVEDFHGGKRVWVRLRVCPSPGSVADADHH
jgi:anti-sigma regulatory factor (Ser/Thr protein kinase)